jgi:hypothetical protein
MSKKYRNCKDCITRACDSAGHNDSEAEKCHEYSEDFIVNNQQSTNEEIRQAFEKEFNPNKSSYEYSEEKDEYMLISIVGSDFGCTVINAMYNAYKTAKQSAQAEIEELKEKLTKSREHVLAQLNRITELEQEAKDAAAGYQSALDKIHKELECKNDEKEKQQDKLKEIWFPIKGYEGIYEVTLFGVVRQLTHIDYRGWTRYGKIISQSINVPGYAFVRLFKDGNKKIKLIHRLVAETFLVDFNKDCIIDHIDCNQLNNFAGNLRVSDLSKNIANSRKSKNIGSYTSEYDAAKAYDKKAVELFGEHARTNEMMNLYENWKQRKTK